MKRLFSTAIIATLTLMLVDAEILRDYESQSNGNLSFSVDSIDYRPDLTRVYGKLQGRPHTSNRIDDVKVIKNTESYSSTDIDGVDFRRYFQWEDDGVIPIEIDFPAMKSGQGVQLIFNTPYGQSQTTAKVCQKHSK
ncbi:MAG: hypothetical protein NC311_07155 [Muribaculaceae bacterium]|nr:hypothetical protein [Muribaculum sp.]MCM1295304.1 hypothetical protein [Muribaculaceae bacterium]